ncbi:MAG: SAM-dependent methyltransferase [Clostridia bacterium]|nr:SAM-dependent methyltransferase [Clostridia bacterium]
MTKIKLDLRLSSVASLVRNGSVVADIGTDHGYLICWLIQNGISPHGIAADLRKGPLENARNTVVECGLDDKVELYLSDGLKELPENGADDIVIAGMGGILIAEILSQAKWVFDKNVRIVAQPMTHPEVLREFLIKNGFKIIEEKTSTDGKHVYCALSAEFCGSESECDESYYYLGELLKNDDDITKKYIDKMLFTLEKKYIALKKSDIDDYIGLEKLINEIKLKVSEAYND